MENLENYKYEKIRLKTLPNDEQESLFKRYEIEICNFSRLKFILIRFLASLPILPLFILTFEVTQNHLQVFVQHYVIIL